MPVMAVQSAETIENIAKDNLHFTTRAKTDNARGFRRLNKVARKHNAKTVKPKQAVSCLGNILL